MPFALASEYDRLTPAQQSLVTYILIDDGEWSEEQIADALRSTFLSDMKVEQRDGWAYQSE